MLRFLILVAAGFFVLSVYAPDTAQELMRRGRDAFVAFQQGPEPIQVEQSAKDNDAGGYVRIRSDRSGHYVTEVDFNGRRLRAIVDTGATLIALRYEDARALGLITPSDRFDIKVSTANGTARAKRITLRSVRIGSIQIENVEAMVLDEGMLGQNLLGMSFLKRLARFEFKKGVLELER
ncbi:MAG: TIGR02281 family clan AA aspartic protease [Xanthobacteraceae bacterium]|jgi:aspartyl protease family protein|nr:TIGR02281 family clan AA aspartic protease [Xanthobacteraceae bacterium]